MAERVTRPQQALERNAKLLFHLTRYMLANPDLLEQLPEKFEIVILPSDDPELLQYNLALLNSHDSGEKPVVFVRLPSSQSLDFEIERPRVYVPLAV